MQRVTVSHVFVCVSAAIGCALSDRCVCVCAGIGCTLSHSEVCVCVCVFVIYFLLACEVSPVCLGD